MPRDWDPALYLRHADERTRPMADLVARVPVDARTVVDLGSGPGHLTPLLHARWPEASITGIDASPAMVDTARRDASAPWVRYELADVRSWSPPAPADVVVSNATLQWVPDHLGLLSRLADHVAPDGALAFSVPGNHDAPSHRLLRELAGRSPYAAHTVGVERPAAHDPEVYLDALAALGWTVDAWETTYVHVLHGPDPVLRWVSATGARPVLQALPDDLREAFVAQYAAALRDAYPERGAGTLLPFRRVFVVATRA
ncbi:methyltransferase domain-containing protein [Cellulosimicrobium cellulans]|uniref:methyltransferase domain-containing protein n=1 Tax=Cellulosimicrobium cellulans TaxID=1710 RepID=UPI00214A602C|nr:methyltransferase domain-containing protein [Cellulosimicrobium cellulans]